MGIETKGHRFKDLTGNRYGRLTVISTAHNTNGEWFWNCTCDCGNTVVRKSSVLISGRVKSCGCYRKEFRLKALVAEHKLYHNYKSTAAHKGYSFELSLEEFLEMTSKACHYCGVEPQRICSSRDKQYVFNGIDRVDNAKGYRVDNCVPCCSTCNYAKRNMTKEQFLTWVKRIYMTQYRKATDMTPGQLIDLLFTTDYKCWWAQEKLLDQSLTAEQRADEARKAQEYNAKRTKLIRTIDRVLDFSDDTNTEKTYPSADEKENYTYFSEDKK